MSPVALALSWASSSSVRSDSNCDREVKLAQFQMRLLEMGEGRLQLRGAALGRSRRIVQFVSHPGAELAQCGQFFTLPQHDLLLQVGFFQVAQPFSFAGWRSGVPAATQD